MALRPFLMKQIYLCDSLVIASLWKQDIPREGEDDYWVGKTALLYITVPYISYTGQNTGLQKNFLSTYK
jgi:hypothetical protein